MELKHLQIDCWRDGNGRLFWRELTREECFEIKAIECAEFYHFKGAVARVSCYVMRGGGTVGRGGALLCAASAVKGTGIPYRIDLDF